MPSNSEITSHTKKWLSRFIIEHNICPFAKREFDKSDKDGNGGGIHYEVVVSETLENQLQELIYSCEQLDRESDVEEGEEGLETSLLILPNGLSDFDDYLDFLDLANELMHKQGYEGVYQLASFHPDYCFDGVDADDASNYTNRSPYPMLHLIREASIEKVLAHYPNPEGIPVRNIEYTRDMGVKSLELLLANCKN
jgi:hypothetical protein